VFNRNDCCAVNLYSAQVQRQRITLIRQRIDKLAVCCKQGDSEKTPRHKNRDISELREYFAQNFPSLFSRKFFTGLLNFTQFVYCLAK